MWEALNFLTLLTLLIIAGLLMHKLRSLHRMAYDLASKRDIDQHYKQIEALLFLQRELDGLHGLPGFRGFAASPDFIAELFRVLAIRLPQNVLELGSGVSTLLMAARLRQLGGGRIVSLDHESDYANKTRALIHNWGLDDYAQVIYAPLVAYQVEDQEYRWYSLDSLPKELYDMLIVDGPPERTQAQARYPAMPLLISYLAEQAVVLVDDSNRVDEISMLARWAKHFPEFKQTHIPLEKGCVMLERFIV